MVLYLYDAPNIQCIVGLSPGLCCECGDTVSNFKRDICEYINRRNIVVSIVSVSCQVWGNSNA